MAHLGILSLDTRFPRINGDVGNPQSYPFTAKVRIVENADATLIVADKPPPRAICDGFIEAAKELEAEGAAALVSTCGFLVHVQDAVASAVKIPVMLSPLSLYPLVKTVCAGKVGILTASKQALGAKTMAAAKIDDAIVRGMDHHALFRDVFLAPKSAQLSDFDRSEIEELVLREAGWLIETGCVSALVFECGNLPPYAATVRRRFGVPVFTAIDAAKLMMPN